MFIKLCSNLDVLDLVPTQATFNFMHCAYKTGGYSNSLRLDSDLELPRQIRLFACVMSHEARALPSYRAVLPSSSRRHRRRHRRRRPWLSVSSHVKLSNAVVLPEHKVVEQHFAPTIAWVQWQLVEAAGFVHEG